jgi:hypothetical protein
MADARKPRTRRQPQARPPAPKQQQPRPPAPKQPRPAGWVDVAPGAAPRSMDAALRGATPVAVLVHADWCGACRAYRATGAWERLVAGLGGACPSVRVENSVLSAAAPGQSRLADALRASGLVRYLPSLYVVTPRGVSPFPGVLLADGDGALDFVRERVG